MAKHFHTKAAPVTETIDKMKLVRSFFDTEEIKKAYEDVLGKRAPGFIVGVLQLVSNSEGLKLADHNSIHNAAIRAAMLNMSLDNNLRHAHISPWKDPATGKVYAQFQIGWRGLVQLCLATDKYDAINAGEVMEGEYNGKDMLTGEYDFSFIKDKATRDKLSVVGYFSHFRLLSGFKKTIYWTLSEVNEHAAKYSESFNRKEGDWITDFPAMAKKTVLKMNLNDWGPKSNELATAIILDQAIITGTEGKVEYLDNPNNKPGAAEVKARSKKTTAATDALKKQLNKRK